MNKYLTGLVMIAASLAPGHALAQYTKTEKITYHDNTALWVLGQTASVTCVAPAECKPAWAPNGIVISEATYNTMAQMVTVKSFGTLEQTLTYNSDGTLATLKDGNNNITTTSSWKRGVPQLITFADSNTISAVVDNNGWIGSVTNEVKARTCYGYDSMGRLASITYPSESAIETCNDQDWNITYQSFSINSAPVGGLPAGHWRQVVATDNARKVTYFDALWRPVITETYDASDVANTLTQSVTRYDSEGRAVFQSYPQRTTDSSVTNTWANPTVPVHASTKGTYTEYDALGRTRSVTQDSELAAPNNLLVTLTEYLPGFKTRVTNPRGQSTLTIYQTFDQPTFDFPTSIDHPEGASTEIYRNVFTNVYALRRRNAVPATEDVWRWYVYHPDQKLCKVIEPETGTTLYLYDNVGNLRYSSHGLNLPDTSSCNIEPGRTAVARTYDVRNRLTTLSFPDGQGNQVWTYKADGQPESITTNNSGTAQVINAYTYKKRGMLSGESSSQVGWYNWSLGYGYDRYGTLTTNTYPTGLAISYYPNALGQATQVKDQSGYTYASGVQYYPNGGIKQFSYGNGIVHTMAQNTRQLPARVTDSGGVLDYETRFDPNGNVSDIFDYANGSNYNRHMQYDGRDRLTAAGAWAFGGDGWHRFTYDSLDNIKSWKLAGVKDYANYVYDTSNRLTGIQNTAGATVVGLSYDALGNLYNKNGQLYSFDYGNRLREVPGKEYYRYDGHGRRVMAWVPATGSILSMYSQSGQPLFSIDERRHVEEENIYLNGSLLTIRERNQVTGLFSNLYQHTDALGSPVAVTDASGAVIKRNFYEPYGAVVGQPNYQGIGYTGHVQDGATGLTYMQQRYYDQAIGVFLSVDPVKPIESKDSRLFHRYSYGFNNPYKFSDPDGRCPMGCPNDIVNVPSIEDSAGVLSLVSDALDKADEFFTALGPYGMPERAAVSPIIVGARVAVVEAKMLAVAARANKIRHIFGKAEHNLGGLVKTFGGEVKALRAIEKATAKAVDVKTAGRFEVVVKVGGQNVTVRGAVVDGEVKIGTAFIPPPPPPPPPPLQEL